MASPEPNPLAKPTKQERPNQPRNLLGKIASALGAATGALGKQTEKTAHTLGNTAKNTGNTLTHAASQTSQIVINTATNLTHAAGHSAQRATSSIGQLTGWIQANPLFRTATESLNLDWLVELLDTVDVQKATAEVDKIRAKHPNDSPGQLAHRLMVRKATLAASTGLASSALPGMATALFALDFAVTMSLQAELVYQIAAAYGLGLENPARKGEVLAIFGLSMGGNKAIEGGVKYATRAGLLGFLKNVPAAGAVIGCSTNAAMTYSLGYAACRFYEAKLNPLQSEQALAASTSDSDTYLQQAIAQEVVMDLILVHIMLANTPEQSLTDSLSTLKTTLGLAPATLETLEKEGLPELSTLLPKVNEDFAIPLIIRCQKIIELDGTVTDAEAKIIHEIRTTLDVKTED
ncbi:EcsC family protein [Leptothoe kymatousa]|uniref:Uncharacterized protein n=1 Tax=Leptothoe kymatousa TAU-MAC 1615 TaxID=2364775 RepID=A0ABS5Y517_9CYAN|nr:EcsC family protein [Leptothoe kymatousa]MBT9312920.1 hypothetical protein [Leptothoe kymatousa TAU-MAC 1615]